MVPRDQDMPNSASIAEAAAASLAGEGIEKPPVDRDDRAELAAISAEIEQIRASVSHIAEAGSDYVKRRVAANSTDLIAENPVRAALWAAFVGFVIGRLSR